jgi:hypothetical protein
VIAISTEGGGGGGKPPLIRGIIIEKMCRDSALSYGNT